MTIFSSFLLQDRASETGSIMEKHSPKPENLSSNKENPDNFEGNSDTSIPAVNDNTYESVDDHVICDEEGEPVYNSSKDSDTFGSGSSGEVDNVSQKSFHSYQNIHHDVQLPCQKATEDIVAAVKKKKDIYEVELHHQDEMGYLLPNEEEITAEKLLISSPHTLPRITGDVSGFGRIQHSYLGFEGIGVDVKHRSAYEHEVLKMLSRQASGKGVSSQAKVGPSYAEMTPVSPDGSTESNSSSSEGSGRKFILAHHDHGPARGLGDVREQDVSQQTSGIKDLETHPLTSIVSHEPHGTVSQALPQDELLEKLQHEARLAQKRKLTKSQSLPRGLKSDVEEHDTKTAKETPV